ncbi:hypothetical protein [Shewanella youngdeokensis]|uniref:Uncharacterized protein n=1 Tax=Shewanella youngdeokensis TaxID=2999068 RepID=A0ABZ0JZN7_9GAMM|nr:hypothetical protein RGE70_02840 [Shewanella sp. DAU334]
MENISLRVNIEGQDNQVDTDWFAIMTKLKLRGVDKEQLEVLYFQLRAGIRVTTRGLSLEKTTASAMGAGLLHEPKFSAHDYAGMLII